MTKTFNVEWRVRLVDASYDGTETILAETDQEAVQLLKQKLNKQMLFAMPLINIVSVTMRCEVRSE